MPASYPGAIKTFTNKVDGIDTVMAGDINDAYNEITPIETELGTLPKGTSASIKERIAAIRSYAGAVADTLVVHGAWVGIGTATPRDIFELHSANPMLLIHNTLGGANTKNFYFANSGDALNIGLGNDAWTAVTDYLKIRAGGKILINDVDNAFSTIGLTINQGASDDEILTLKSSDVVQQMTNVSEADTFGLFKKIIAAKGGLRIIGLTEDNEAFQIIGGVAFDTAIRSTAAIAPVEIDSGLNDGAGNLAVNAANQNMLAVRNWGTTRFILDTDGDSHQDVGTAWTNFDEDDDAALLQDLALSVSQEHDPIHEEFSDFLKYNREMLTKAKLVDFNDDGHHFVNMSKLTMLLTGAVRQLASRLAKAELTIAQQQLLMEG